MSDMPFSSLNRSDAGKRREQATPAAFAIEDAAHLVAARAVANKMAMHKFDTRGIFALGDEAHLHFGLQIRVVLPIGVNLPREHQPRGRLPRKHATPVTRAPVVTALVPAPADARLDYRIHRLCLADLVGGER